MICYYDHVDVGPVPAEEDCAQVGTPDYETHSARECRVFKRMLQRLHPVPEGVDAGFVVRKHPHDLGSYREVAVRYGPGHLAFAESVERSSPVEWDAIARYELLWFQRREELQQAVREGRMAPDAVPPHYAQADPPPLDGQASLDELLARHPL